MSGALINGCNWDREGVLTFCYDINDYFPFSLLFLLSFSLLAPSQYFPPILSFLFIIYLSFHPVLQYLLFPFPFLLPFYRIPPPPFPNSVSTPFLLLRVLLFYVCHLFFLFCHLLSYSVTTSFFYSPSSFSFSSSSCMSPSPFAVSSNKIYFRFIFPYFPSRISHPLILLIFLHLILSFSSSATQSFIFSSLFLPRLSRPPVIFFLVKTISLIISNF